MISFVFYIAHEHVICERNNRKNLYEGVLEWLSTVSKNIRLFETH